ncbi:ABC transporter substrate-binding protein [Allofournierella sp.]|uniref:ABC transporter substrate-binding protein n=1 Tax=Allofournierella sp. TaxID=1940256 RepID=UPI003AB8E110
MKKCVAMLLAALLFTVCLAGCGAPAASGGASAPPAAGTAAPQTLVSWTDMTPEEGAELTVMGGAHLTSVAEYVLQDFMQKTGITIHFEKYSYDEYPTKMKIAMSQGDSVPDVLIVHDLFIRQFVEAGYLMELSSILDRENTLDVLTPVSFNGGVYGIPNQVTNQFIFMYRGDVYDQLGLTAPATFDEYFAQAQTLKEAGYYAGAWDPSKPGCVNLFLNYLYMLGGDVLDTEGNVSLNKAEETIALLQKCYDAGIWHKSEQSNSDEYWTAFNAGKIAAFPGAAAHVAYYETNADPNGQGGYGSLQIAPAMKFSADGPDTYLNNTEFWAINAKTKYPNAARMVVSYLTQTVEAAQKCANIDEEGLMARFGTGYLPGLEMLAEGEGVAASEPFGGEKTVAVLAQDILNKAGSILLPYVDVRSSEINTIIAEVLGEMFLKGTYTPETAAAEMRARIGKI